MREDCSICGEARGAGPGAFRRLWTGEATALLASVGALTVGHVLLCPFGHSRSWAARPLAELDDALKLASSFASVLTERLGEPVHIFEHGNATYGNRVACSVEHAHMHLVPARWDPSSWLAAIPESRWMDASWRAAELRALTTDREYLLHRGHDNSARIWVTEDQPIPAQLMRRAFARAAGEEERWNWREEPAVDRVAATCELFTDLLLPATTA